MYPAATARVQPLHRQQQRATAAAAAVTPRRPPRQDRCCQTEATHARTETATRREGATRTAEPVGNAPDAERERESARSHNAVPGRASVIKEPLAPRLCPAASLCAPADMRVCITQSDSDHLRAVGRATVPERARDSCMMIAAVWVLKKRGWGGVQLQTGDTCSWRRGCGLRFAWGAKIFGVGWV